VTLKLAISAFAIFVIAVVMSMVGRGGGNFYLLALVLSGVAMHQAATTGQLIMFLTAGAALVLFQKHRTVDWKLVLLIGPPVEMMALVGGYLAHLVPGQTLKLVFAGLLVIAGFLMLRPVRERPAAELASRGVLRGSFGGHEYTVNVWLALPVTLLTGLVAGMIGVSGGSFLVPLMVLACSVPMRVAVGTASAMVAATALMGFIGHVAGGDFPGAMSLVLAAAGVAGGLLGGALSVRTRPRSLKLIFAYLTLGAAAFMFVNSIVSRSG